jgi:hypothetical protein
MKCPRCQHDNPLGQKFCGECGARLALACASCGTSNPPGQKFCGECGTGLPEAPARSVPPESYTPKHLAERILTSKTALEGERKQVTVLFADLKGSMELLATSASASSTAAWSSAIRLRSTSPPRRRCTERWT